MFSSNTSQVSGGAANYIEDVFSTWIYAGTGAAQTINNGIDLAGKGGLVWTKSRSASSHRLFDTVRGATKVLYTEDTSAQSTEAQSITSFGSTGFTLGTSSPNASGDNYVSWTFREQPKFFDVVTYTGNGTSSNAVSHTLASQPAFIITKRTDSTGNWIVWHRTGTSWVIGYLNTTGSMPSAGAINASVTTTQVDIGAINATAGENANINGATYVMYVFAHNAGGFGLTGTDNVISCGTVSTTATPTFVDLGYEPQFLLIKPVSATGNWLLLDTMRGFSNTQANTLFPNLSNAETINATTTRTPTATGFTFESGSALTWIYIAIRRGPMKVPTTGTSVFTPTAYTGNGAGNRLINAGFPPDIFIPRVLNGANGYNTWVVSRIQGGGQTMAFNAQFQEQVYDTGSFTREQLGYVTRSSTNIANPAGDSMIGYSIRRAPSCADVVCWTANGSTANINHNLTVRPQLILAKNRLNSSNWFVLVGGSGRFSINSTNAAGFNSGGADCLGSTTTTFNTSFLQDINSNQPIANTQPYVAYLFASAPGVSKVGSFTGTGITQVIDCGFTSGARFVMIKATSATGNWFVWDSARGISAGNDPYVLFNDSVPENTITDWVGTAATGFQLIVGGSNLANSNGVTYIFLAIA